MIEMWRDMSWWQKLKYKVGFWLQKRESWFTGWKPCPKEQMGYTCRHQILSNGVLECGEEENYWKGDNG